MFDISTNAFDFFDTPSYTVSDILNVGIHDLVDLTHINWDKVVKEGSIGMLNKDTLSIDNVKYYIKMSSYSISQGVYGIESVAEVIASRLARVLGINCVEYKLVYAKVKKDGKVFNTYLCISKDYKNFGDKVLPFEDYYIFNRRDVYESTIDFCKRTLNIKQIYKMFLYDYIINNLDRHGANLEVILNSNKVAPLFDNGSSLYSATPIERLLLDGYYMDDSQVNNYIGSRSLLDNINKIDIPIKISKLTYSDKQFIFEDLEDILGIERINVTWEYIYRRYTYAKKIYNI